MCLAPWRSKSSVWLNHEWSCWRPSTKSGTLSVPSTDRTGCVTLAACSGPKVHCRIAGISTPKNISASATAWSRAPGTAVSTAFSQPWPPNTPECLQRGALVARAVVLHGGEDVPFDVRPTARDHLQRRLQHGKGMDEVRTVSGQLQRDHRSIGVAADMGTLHPEVIQQGDGVGGLALDAHRRRPDRAPHVSPAMVGDHPVQRGKASFLQQGARQTVGQHAEMDQQDGLAGTFNGILQNDAVNF